MCLYPTIGRNPKYRMNEKNGGNIPAITDIRVLAVPIGCGVCIECRKQKSREWMVRLTEDIKEHKNGKFIALTFANEEITKLAKEIKGLEGYDLDNEIATLAVRRFTERWRKKYGKTIRHWLITELGHEGTENLHMHGIVWTDEPNSEITKAWKYGRVWFGTYVNEKTISYSTKYVTKIDPKHKYYKSKILTSNGIGAGYLRRTDKNKNKYKFEGGTNEAYKMRSGHKIALPKYYRNKIYSEEEREELWIEKLNKQERWVCGERVDISEGEEGYHMLLKYHRERNTKLGYMTPKINWDRKRYENERRKLRMMERRK